MVIVLIISVIKEYVLEIVLRDYIKYIQTYICARDSPKERDYIEHK